MRIVVSCSPASSVVVVIAMVMMILHLIFNRFMAPACFHLHLLKAEEAAENIEEEEENLLKLSPPESSAAAANCGTTSPSTALPLSSTYN
jgi:hypothetical protein